jgi:hypothetical protein
MTTINFPISPTIGQQYTYFGRTWEWNGEGWSQVPALTQAPIQFQNEGLDLGTPGTVEEVDFVGDGVSATRLADTVTVDIPGVAIDPIWQVKGDLAVADAAGTAQRLAAGTNGYALVADSTQPLGVKWAAAGSPGGSSGTVQFNNAGAFGGITNLTSDGTNVTALTVAGAKANFAATATGYASINIPHGTAPTTPGDGDVWTTTAGIYVRINGGTVGPLGTGGGGQTAIQFKDEGTNLGSSGTVDTVDFTGSGVAASRSGNTVTVSVTGGGSSAAYNDIVLSDGPTRYYRLNETSGSTATDSSAAASNGTYNNSPTLNQTSMLYSGAGAAVLFNASNQSMTFSGGLTGSLDANALVIFDAIVNISGTSINGCMFSVQVDGKNFAMGVGTTTFAAAGNNFVGLQQGNSYFGSGFALGTGNKYLAMAWSKAASQLYFFVNGICVHVATTNATGFSGVDCVGALATSSLAFPGKMQEAATFYAVVSNTVAGTPLQTAANLIYRRYQNFARAV